MASSFLGITRESVYSPGKVSADRAILEAVAARLARQHDVRVVSGESPLPEIEPDVCVFAMCQGPAPLATLHRWAAAGVRVINSATAIENCHRWRMVPALERAGVTAPETVVLSPAVADALPAWVESGAWLKRGDVHATEPDDVTYVTGVAAAQAALLRFRHRGVARAVVQRHVPGEVIKFYAVTGRFFAYFPPAQVSLSLSAEEIASMQALAERGAAALGLEVFGGDCVRAGAHDFWLIDLNDWPSYAPCLSAAAEAIAVYLHAQNEKVVS